MADNESTQIIPNSQSERTQIAESTSDGDSTQTSAAPGDRDDATQIAAAPSVNQDETYLAGEHATTDDATRIASTTVISMDDIRPKNSSKDNIPEFLGRYKVEKILGQGAMGVVYKGIDLDIGRPVAIKTVLTSLLDMDYSDEIKERFIREAQAAGRINHPGIVSVYELGVDGDTTFIAMEFVEGQELEDLLKSGHRFRAEDTVQLIDQLLDALSVAHEQGVVHRDIKPANIIVTKRGIKVADFGIANLENSSMTQVGDVLGTPNYMSPEQVYGHPVDGRSDLFSVGTILYLLLTGEKPFSGGSPETVMHRVVNNEPDPPSVLNKLVPKGFDDIIRKAMAKVPSDRFKTAQEFQQALKGAFGDTTSLTPGDTLIESPSGSDAHGVPKFPGKYNIAKVLGQSVMGLVVIGGLALLFEIFAPPGLLPGDSSGVDKPVPPIGIKAFGFLQVTIDPEIQANVFIGDKKVGETPFRKEVEVGDYEVRISKPNYHDLVMDIEVEEGADVQLVDLTLNKM